MKTTEITIKAGTIFEMPLIVTKPGTTVHWVFHTKGYDIRFGIAKGRAGPNREFLVANTNYAPDAPQQGKVSFPTADDYFLVWDNSYSWIREKHVVYSVEIVLPELTLDEHIECARTILEDVDKMNKMIVEYKGKEEEKKEQLSTLEKEREAKYQELEAIKKEIECVEEKIKDCDSSISTFQEEAKQEQATIEMLTSLAPFLLEGDRILSMLTGPEILRLGCVNKIMNMAVHRDVVWMKVFKQDCQEDVNTVIRNDWLKRKWEMLNPSVLPSEKDGEDGEASKAGEAL